MKYHKDFQTIENELNFAYERNDIQQISSLLANDWYILEPSIGPVNKTQFLAAIQAGRLVHSKMQKQLIQVTVFHETAIVLSRGKNTGYYNGEKFDAEHWITNIYQMQNKTWSCIATIEAPVIG